MAGWATETIWQGFSPRIFELHADVLPSKVQSGGIIPTEPETNPVVISQPRNVHTTIRETPVIVRDISDQAPADRFEVGGTLRPLRLVFHATGNGKRDQHENDDDDHHNHQLGYREAAGERPPRGRNTRAELEWGMVIHSLWTGYFRGEKGRFPLFPNDSINWFGGVIEHSRISLEHLRHPNAESKRRESGMVSLHRYRTMILRSRFLPHNLEMKESTRS
jgi:hypothetical protein